MSSTGKPEGGRGEPEAGRGPERAPARGFPGGEANGDAARCAFCGSEDTERIALFGSTLLVSQHYCRGCRSVFEKLKR